MTTKQTLQMIKACIRAEKKIYEDYLDPNDRSNKDCQDYVQGVMVGLNKADSIINFYLSGIKDETELDLEPTV